MMISALALFSATANGGMRLLLLLLLLLAVILILAGGVIALLTWSKQRKDSLNVARSERR
jgi:flagellar basal body-associated protein FliL